MFRLKLTGNEVTLLIIALVLQLAIFLIWNLYGSHEFLEDDGRFYLHNAQSVLSTRQFSSFGLGVPDADRTPVYPLVLAALYAVVPQVWFLVIGQNVLALISILVVYRFSRHILRLLLGEHDVKIGERLSFLAGLLFVLESERLNNSSMLLTESLLVIFFFLSLSYFIEWLMMDKKVKNILLSGMFLGLAVLTKPVVQAFIFILLAFMAAAYIRRREEFKKIAIAAAVLVASFTLVLFPWCLRNRIQFGSWQVSPLFPNAFWQERVLGSELYRMNKNGVEDDHFAENEYKRIMGRIWADHPDLLLKFSRDKAPEHVFRDFAAGPYLWADTIRYVINQPLHFFGYSAHQTGLFFVDSAFSSVSHKVISKILPIPDVIFYPYLFWGGRLVWTMYYVIIVVGFLMTMGKVKKQQLLILFVASPVLYIALLNAFGATTRYRLLVNPLIFLLAVYFGFLIINTFQEKYALKPRK